MTMTYSRPGGMTAHEKEKIRHRLGGGVTPAIAPEPGSNQLAGSQPSSPVVGGTPDEVAEFNRKRQLGLRLDRHRAAGAAVKTSLDTALVTLAAAHREAAKEAENAKLLS